MISTWICIDQIISIGNAYQANHEQMIISMISGMLCFMHIGDKRIPASRQAQVINSFIIKCQWMNVFQMNPGLNR